MNFHRFPFKVIPLRCNILVPAFFPILKALLICTFWYVLKLSQRFGFYLLNRGKPRPFMGLFNLGNRKKSQGAKSGEYGDLGLITVLFLAKKLQTYNEE